MKKQLLAAIVAALVAGVAHADVGVWASGAATGGLLGQQTGAVSPLSSAGQVGGAASGSVAGGAGAAFGPNGVIGGSASLSGSTQTATGQSAATSSLIFAPFTIGTSSASGATGTQTSGSAAGTITGGFGF